MLTPKKCSIAFVKLFTTVRANLKRHKRVYILSSEHSYRPMKARVAAQLFCKASYSTGQG